MAASNQFDQRSDLADESQHLPASKYNGILANRWAILSLLFFVTAALGLPLLWISPAFTRSEKWLWSVVITVYTIILIAITALIVWWSYNRIAELLL